jgi:hypothetical protein
MKKECKCKPFCMGPKYCGAKYNTMVIHKDENGKPTWFRQKSSDCSSPEWEKIVIPKK